MTGYDERQTQYPYGNQHDPYDRRGGQRGSRAALYTSIGAAGLAAAGLVTALVLGLGGSATTATSGTPPDHATPPAAQVQPANTQPTNTQPTNTQPTNTQPTASPTVRLLQQQLGQLNYYEGPVTGVWNTQTTQAITYLQRDAHLPQTGHLNPATQSALNRMLATGNNQMAG